MKTNAIKFTFADQSFNQNGTLIVGIMPERKLLPKAAELDIKMDGLLSRALMATHTTGKLGEIVEVLAPHGLKADRVLMVGFGPTNELTAAKLQTLGGIVMASVLASPLQEASWLLDTIEDDSTNMCMADITLALTQGAQLRAYRFDRYKTSEKPENKTNLEQFTFMLSAAASSSAKKRYDQDIKKVTDGVYLARDLVNEPPNILYPGNYAKRLEKLESIGLDIEVLGNKELSSLGMSALLGVGQGSSHKPRLVVIRWQGRDSETQPLALIGKGVTFDSGGLSLKPAKSMEEMKTDMAGSAAIAGAMAAIAGRKAKTNVVAVLAMVENMPSATAQRPGDVVKSLSGQTIEVLNTDAEGRLILADALWYTQDRFKPKAMIDVATLTGAIITSLGHENAGLFTNDDKLAADVTRAGISTGETVWRMPLDESYAPLLNSNIADVKNTGDGSAGSITAAMFLKRFTNGLPWAHLDIAGAAWSSKDSSVTPKGASGWGVRLLDQLVRDVYELQ